MDYEEFRHQYEIQHPASVPQMEAEISIYPDWLEKVVGVMFVSASLLSGIHTVPAVRGGMTSGFWPQQVIDFVSMLSFVAIELVFFVAAYALMRKRQWHVVITLLAAFVVAMVANLKENVQAYQAGDPGTIIVAVTLGIGAPLIAFMAGKMFVDIHRARRSVGTETRRNYDAARVSWDKEINRAWEKYQKSATHNQQTTVSDRLSTQTDNRQSGYGYNRNASAVDIALAYLKDNPDAIKLSARAFGDAVGIGKDSALKAQKMYAENRHNGNGHNGYEN